jgi:hypothetical protein
VYVLEIENKPEILSRLTEIEERISKEIGVNKFEREHYKMFTKR